MIAMPACYLCLDKGELVIRGTLRACPVAACDAIRPVVPDASITCAVVDAVRADLQRRSQLGISKYGSTLHQNPHRHEPRYWLNHAYEEALDLANYLKCELMRLDGEMPRK